MPVTGQETVQQPLQTGHCIRSLNTATHDWLLMTDCQLSRTSSKDKSLYRDECDSSPPPALRAGSARNDSTRLVPRVSWTAHVLPTHHPRPSGSRPTPYP